VARAFSILSVTNFNAIIHSIQANFNSLNEAKQKGTIKQQKIRKKNKKNQCILGIINNQ
jgi:hypothetical protein